MQKNRIIKLQFNKATAFSATIMIMAMLVCAGCVKGNSAAVPVEETQSEQQQETIETAEEPQQEPDAESLLLSEPEVVPELPPETVRLVMVGDVLLHTPINESALQEDGSYDYSHLFRNITPDIQSADIAIVNQEVILGGTELGLSGYPAFNSAYEVGDALADAGFDVVLHATNHALDKGRKGILNCLTYWREQQPQMQVTGIYDSAKAQESELCICERNGIKVAILNYTYGTNGIPMPEGMPYAVNLMNQEQIAKDVKRAKEAADFVVVCPHWGTEYSHEISGQQDKYAQIFADLGVDLVIGTHPHVIEPVAWVESTIADGTSEENPHQMLVYYSLGNFINATSGAGAGVADRMIGAMADVTLTRNDDGVVVIEDYRVAPLVTQMLTGRSRITTYKLSDYSQKLADENEIIERDSVFSFEYCKEVCRNVFGDLYE